MGKQVLTLNEIIINSLIKSPKTDEEIAEDIGYDLKDQERKNEFYAVLNLFQKERITELDGVTGVYSIRSEFFG